MTQDLKDPVNRPMLIDCEGDAEWENYEPVLGTFEDEPNGYIDRSEVSDRGSTQ